MRGKVRTEEALDHQFPECASGSGVTNATGNGCLGCEELSKPSELQANKLVHFL